MRELSYLDVECRCTMAILLKHFPTENRRRYCSAALFLNVRTFSADWRADKSFGYRCPWKGICLFKKEKRIYFGVAWRCFLDGCVDHILSLNRNNIEVQSGNFSSLWEIWTAQHLSYPKTNGLKKDIHRLQRNLRNALLSGPTGWKHQKSVRQTKALSVTKQLNDETL